jgi:hypothetical protein
MKKDGLEIILLGKINQTQNDRYCMFSHMQNLEFFLKKDMKIEGDYLG